MELGGVTHLFTLRFHGLESVEWTTTSANSDRVGQYLPALVGPIYGGLCVLQCGLIFLSTFYVLCSSQVCSDCANVAMKGKVKAI